MIINGSQDNNLEKLDRYTTKILSDMSMKSDYAMYDESLNFILVEGQTEVTFFSKYKKSKNHFVEINEIVESQKSMRARQEEGTFNNKKAILNIVGNVFNLPFLQKKNIFGIVDKDFDKEYPYSQLHSRIFSNDTHDLETMMLDSDGNAACNLRQIKCSKENVSRALYMAYQIGLVKFAVSKFRHLRVVSEIDFNIYFSDDKLNIKKYISFINRDLNNDKKVVYADVVKVLKNMKKLDKDNNFNFDIKDFCDNISKEVWQIVNGHDFLFILFHIYKVKTTKRKASEDLISAYKIANFENTALFAKMKKAKLFA